MMILLTGGQSEAVLAWSQAAPVAAPHSPPASDEVRRKREETATAVADGMAAELIDGRMGRLISRFTYAAIIIVLLLCGMGLPLPEEIPILTSGVLARMGHVSPWPALFAVLFGVMAGDSMMFLLGRSWGSHLLEHRFSRRMLTAERQAQIAQAFHKYGASIIFVARFLPGLRAPIFLTAGSLKVSFAKFFCMDGLAALVSIPLSFWVAYLFTDRLKEVLEVSHHALYWLLGILAVGLVVGHVLWDRWRQSRRRNAPPAVSLPQSENIAGPPAGPSTTTAAPDEGDHNVPG